MGKHLKVVRKRVAKNTRPEWLANPGDGVTTQIAGMMSWKRPHDSGSEREFIARYIAPLGARPDRHGNYAVTVGKSRTLFTAHTDTVHKRTGTQGVTIDRGILSLTNTHDECLGADDAAGVYVMAEMVRRGVPGHYVFFRQEETGGKGSRGYTEDNAEWITQNIDRVVSFDRAGYNSVITHQSWSRCCSDDFGQALADSLGYILDDSGTFTDSANFTDLVPECTNLSVGYFGQHGPTEYLDSWFLAGMADKFAGVDWEHLPTVREPGDPATDWDAADWRDWWGSSSRLDLTRRGLTDLVREYPDIAADILEQCGIDEQEFEAVIMSMIGCR